MPIYAYRCTACGHAKDVLQKMSDPVLSDCPACGAASFVKQVTAAGFQLKGSGWYVTDFKGGSAAPPPADGAKVDAESGAPATADPAKGEPAKGDPANSDRANSEAPKSDAAKPGAAASASTPKADAPAATKPAPAVAPRGAAPAAESPR